MQIKKIPQSCHSGKRWIWLLEALSKLTVPTISGFTMGHIQLATRLLCWAGINDELSRMDSVTNHHIVSAVCTTILGEPGSPKRDVVGIRITQSITRNS